MTKDCKENGVKCMNGEIVTPSEMVIELTAENISLQRKIRELQEKHDKLWEDFDKLNGFRFKGIERLQKAKKFACELWEEMPNTDDDEFFKNWNVKVLDNQYGFLWENEDE